MRSMTAFLSPASSGRQCLKSKSFPWPVCPILDGSRLLSCSQTLFNCLLPIRTTLGVALPHCLHVFIGR